MYKNIFFHKKLPFLIVISLITIISGCKMKRVNPYDPKSSHFVGEGLVKGNVDIPAGASVTDGDLIVNAFSDTCSVGDDGSFLINIPNVEGFQLVTASFKTGEGNSVLLAYGTNDELKNFRFSSRSTAIALCLMSPLLAGASESQKLEMEGKVVASSDFNSLVSKVEEVIKSDPSNLNNYDAHPDLYNDATRIVYNILGSTKGVSKSGELRIEDDTGNALDYINSINLYYGYRRTDRGSETNPDYWVIASGDAKWAWKIPPWKRVEVSNELSGNEENVVFLSAGYGSGALTDRTRYAGTVENTMKGVFMVVNIVVPLFTGIPLPSLEQYHSTLVAHQGGFCKIIEPEIEEIITCEQNGDYLGIALAYLKTQGKLWANEDFLNWVTSEVGGDIFMGFMQKEITQSGVEAAKQTLGVFGKTLSEQGEQIIVGLFKGITAVIEAGPQVGYFIYDIVDAPNEMCFYVKQTNDVPTVCQTMPPNKPNAPNGPLTTNAGTSVTFTAVTTDPDGDNISYEFEWGDGSQNSFSNQVSSGVKGQAHHTYSSGGTFNVEVSARDVHGCPSDWSTASIISVGGNNLPKTPSIPFGNSSGKVDTSYVFSSSATDPDGDSVTIRFDWGNGDTSNWNNNNFVASGQTVTMSYSWATANTYFVKAQAKDIHGAPSGWSSGHQIVISNVSGNNPPYAPSNPSPVNGAINQSISTNLSWTGGDPDGDAVTYDVYFGPSNPPAGVSNSQPSVTYNPGTLNNNQPYYWRIVAKDEHSATTVGPVWNFATIPAGVNNHPPNVPSYPSPTDGAQNQSINTNLSWTGGDPDGDKVTYDIYFGTSNPPTTLVSNSQPSVTYIPGTLNNNTTYYWMILAKDEHGKTTIGPVWDFTTMPVVVNNLPKIDVSTTNFDVVLQTGIMTDRSFRISNTGAATLIYSIFKNPSIAWLNAGGGGSLAPQGVDYRTLLFDATSLPANDYTTTLVINSNDSANTPINIPVTLHVTPSPETTIDITNITGDTYLDMSHKVNGSFSLLFAKSGKYFEKNFDWPLIRFDLSQIQGWTSISNATLRVYCNFLITGCSVGVETHKMDSYWNEATITGDTSIKYDTGASDYEIINNSFQWFNFSVTSIVQQWVNGSNNYGFLLLPVSATVTGPGSTDSTVAFVSKEGATGSYSGCSAKLIVTGTPYKK